MKKILMILIGICFMFSATMAEALYPWDALIGVTAEAGKPYPVSIEFGVVAGTYEAYIDWGDNTTTGWIPLGFCLGPPFMPPWPCAPLIMEHTWNEPGGYDVVGKIRGAPYGEGGRYILRVMVDPPPEPPPPLPPIIEMPISGKAEKQFSLWFMAPLCNGTEAECQANPFAPECHTCNRTLHITGMTTGGTFFVRERLPAPPYDIVNTSSTYEFHKEPSDFDLSEILPEAMFSSGIFEVVAKTEMKSVPAIGLVVTEVEGNYRFAVPAIRKK